jgi:hypothetical protein
VKTTPTTQNPECDLQIGQACEAARVAVEKVGANTHGQSIEKTYRCVPLR